MRRSALSKYLSKRLENLQPYTPGEQPQDQQYIKLNTNENPYPPSPRVLAAVRAAADERLRLYPPPESDEFKAAIAGYHGVETGQVFVGNGSDEVLAHVFHALLDHGRPVLFPDITYSFYPVYCGLYGVEYEQVALDGDFGIVAGDYLKPGAQKPGGIIFPNPNAPTGRLLPLDEVEKIVAGNPDSVVVVDEAYIDFGGEAIPTAIALIAKYPNLLVVHTLSKSRSLAGLRVGYAIGHPELIEGLERVKNSFNSYPLDRLAIAGAVAAMDDLVHFETTRKAVMKSREALIADMAKLGFETLPSAANFIFTRHPKHDAAMLAVALRERSIIVRHFKLPRIEQYLRITIGTDEQCMALLAALREIL